MSNRYRNLFDTVKSVASGRDNLRILEVGVWNGENTRKHLEQATKICRHVSYFGFDLFEEYSSDVEKSEIGKKKPPLSQDAIQKKLEKTGASIGLFAGNTHKTLRAASKSLPEMDFIFLDGGHSLETIRSDWDNLQSLIGKDTVVLLDDHYAGNNTAGCKTLVDSEPGYDFEILDPTDHFDTHGGLDINMVLAKRKSNG